MSQHNQEWCPSDLHLAVMDIKESSQGLIIYMYAKISVVTRVFLFKEFHGLPKSNPLEGG